ncbi:MAG: ferrous iron transporter B, partial [Clostridia bacterium]|nr:ferrous iron transporter B [Clostridia bacterium]
ILLTLLFSFVLSKTILKGFPSSFTLELPPYRKPQIGKVLLRSVFDRTLFVLGRAISVAAPAGLIIYIMANVTVANASLLSHCASALDPFGRLLGMDGVLIMAFILGLPANEIVMPIAIMAYMSSGTLTEFQNLESLKLLLTENGWTWLTATCTMLFSLLHWPCSTTLISIKKETGSLKWACIAFLLPTATGMIRCMLFTCLARSFCLA